MGQKGGNRKGRGGKREKNVREAGDSEPLSPSSAVVNSLCNSCARTLNFLSLSSSLS